MYMRQHVISLCRLQQSFLSAHDRNILHDIVNILTPFEEATDFAQIEHIPPAGYVLPCIRGLRHHLENMVSKYHSGFVRALKVSFERRMPEYEQNKAYIRAAILDPRFKLRWCTDDSERNKLEKELNEEVTRLRLQTPTSSNTDQEPPPAKKQKQKELFSFMSDAEMLTSHAQSSSNTETCDYLQAPSLPIGKNPATFWKENQRTYPILATIAKDVLGVPASSTAVERLFSIAGKVFTPERCRLTDSRFKQLMFIRCNNVHEE